MTYANMIGIVLTDYISTYESDVTADILAAADELLDELNPINVSHYITNPSFESNLDGGPIMDSKHTIQAHWVPTKMVIVFVNNGRIMEVILV